MSVQSGHFDGLLVNNNRQKVKSIVCVAKSNW